MRILSMIKMDVRLIVRDGITLVMAFCPVLFALIFTAVTGGGTAGGYTFALNGDAPPAFVMQLERFGTVEHMSDRAELERRIRGYDDAIGFDLSGNRAEIVLQGNEPAHHAAAAQTLLQSAARGDLPPVRSEKVELLSDVIRNFSAALILMTALFISAAVCAFNVVLERESRAVRALSVSPLGFARYALARTLLALAIALVNIPLCAAVMGHSAQIPQLLLVTLCCVPIAAIVIFALGAAAANQIAAIGSLKLLMPVLLAVPLAALFIPENLRFLLYALPNYWQYEAFAGALGGSFDPLATALCAAVGCLWLVLAYRLARSRIR